jgi:hypothetical protein
MEIYNMKNIIFAAGLAVMVTSSAFAFGPDQVQGQAQGQAAISDVDVRSSNTNVGITSSDSYSSARGGEVKNSGNSDSYSSAYADGGKGGKGGDAYQHQSNSSKNDNESKASLYVEGETDNSVHIEKEARIPVNTAFAPNLTASEDTCMGSTTAGGQGVTFGLSFGTTWKDHDCVVRKDARFLHSAGHQNVALSYLCKDKKSIMEAVATAGSDAEKIACGIAVTLPPVAVPVPTPTTSKPIGG